jgi:membrane dipeptidase
VNKFEEDPGPIRVFDGHNDVLLRIQADSPHISRWFFEGSDSGHIDLPRARRGGFAGGLFALWVPIPPGARGGNEPKIHLGDGAWERPLAPPVDPMLARAKILTRLSTMLRLERAAPDQVVIVRDPDHLRAEVESERLAIVLHLEGAEAIDPDLRFLDVLYAAGLRSLGLTWSRPNLFGDGVPFRYPVSPDIGPGLSQIGKDLVEACNELGILVDLAHLNLKGFEDVAERSIAPLVVSHACAHSISATTRNLLDEQLDAIRASGGLVGLNFDCADLRPDGKLDPDTSLDAVVRQLEFLAERMGPEHIALGSDFDGAIIPNEIGDVTGLPRIFAALRERGWGEDQIELLARGNWLRVIEATWHLRSASPA